MNSLVMQYLSAFSRRRQAECGDGAVSGASWDFLTSPHHTRGTLCARAAFKFDYY